MVCVYECCMAQLSHTPVLYIIGPTVDPSGCAQQTLDFHYRRTLSAGMACASSFASLTVVSQGSWDCTMVRPTEDLLLFPLESPSFVPIKELVFQIGIPNPANGICETPVGREASMRPHRAEREEAH